MEAILLGVAENQRHRAVLGEFAVAAEVEQDEIVLAAVRGEMLDRLMRFAPAGIGEQFDILEAAQFGLREQVPDLLYVVERIFQRREGGVAIVAAGAKQGAPHSGAR